MVYGILAEEMRSVVHRAGRCDDPDASEEDRARA
jgi:hypothetical protein